jgi:N-acetylglucosamine-6-phosphate deacetylase
MNMSASMTPFVPPLSTATPAVSVGMQGQIATPEPGAFAYIVFWDGDYRVCQTIVSGKSVYKI